MAPSPSEAHGRTNSSTFERKSLIGGTPTIDQSAPVPSAGVGAPTCWASRLAMGRSLAGGGNTRGRTGPRRGAPRRTDPRARGHHTPPRAASHGRARPSTRDPYGRWHLRQNRNLGGRLLPREPRPLGRRGPVPQTRRGVGAGALLQFTRPTGRALSRYLSRYPLFGALFVDAESPPVPAPLGVRPRSSRCEQGADSL